MEEKIQKILANAGYGSRRYIESLINLKLIKINNNTINIGYRISAKAIKNISINNKNYKFILNTNILPKLLLYNKPEGEICTKKDCQNRSIVFNQLPKLFHENWISIGRLDINSSGLLLFTTNGDLAYRLMHPKFNLKRKYLVRVFGNFNINFFKKVKQKIYLKDGFSHFDSVKFIKGKNKNRWFSISISEGRNREVRRMWNHLGFKVNKLVRIGYGSIKLPPNIFPGQWKLLSDAHIKSILKTVHLHF